MKSLTFASQGMQAAGSLGVQYEEEAAVFNLELLIRVVLENRYEIIDIMQSNLFSRSFISFCQFFTGCFYFNFGIRMVSK